MTGASCRNVPDSGWFHSNIVRKMNDKNENTACAASGDRMRIVRKEALPTSRWSGGTTTELAIWPEDAVYAERNFTWRVSSARVEAEESVFTSLPGIARCLMVLDGTLYLHHEGHYDTVLERFGQDNFCGSWHTASRGRVTDFNLMTASGEGRVQLLEIDASSVREVALMPVVAGWGCVGEVFYFLSGGVSLAFADGSRTEMAAGDVLVVHRETAGLPLAVAMENRGKAAAEIVRAVIYHD